MKLHKALPVASVALFALYFASANISWASPQQGTASAPPASATADSGASVPTAEIIRRFSENESRFQIERGNYTYSQSVLVEGSMADGRDGGKYEMDSDIVFTPAGKRYEKVTYAPQPTLTAFDMSPQDMSDLESIQPFVLTSADLSKYDVKYDGREMIDSLNTYRFNVAPKKIEKDQRYFQGTIWVDDHDMAIVKSDGKAVPDIVSKQGANRFPRFVTYRENIEGDFWFPTYTHADDSLDLGTEGHPNVVRVRMTVRYKNYKRFGSTVRVGPSTEIKEPPADSTAPSGTPPTPPR